MNPSDVLDLTGGVATYATLERMCGRAAVRRSVARGTIVRVTRGRYALPERDPAQTALAVGGVLCLSSAAEHHGWSVKETTPVPHVCFPLNRRVNTNARKQVHPHWAALTAGEVQGAATSPAKTLEMCARTLPFDEALAIADSAVRAGYSADLRALRHARGRGAARIKKVVAHADGRSANAFESVLRAIAIEIPLALTPQVTIGQVRPDLVNEDLRLVVEADSFAWHGSRHALHADTVRYNALVAAGWTVLRFSWEDVIGHPERVKDVLERTAIQNWGANSPESTMSPLS